MTHPNSEEPCGYEPDDEYISLWKDPSSIPYKRLQFLKNHPLKEVLKIQRLIYERESFQLPISANLEISNNNEEDSFSTNKIVPIVAHIIRRANGTDGLSVTELNDAISTANGFYKNFQFFLEVCQIRFIDSDDTFNFTHSSRNATASSNQLKVVSNNVARKINIYFVPNSNTSWTWRPNSGTTTQHILMKNSQAINGTTLSHELGHWFDLLHTHDGGDELVDGSNCETAGDFVCDTPADPNLLGRVNASCVYTSTIVDANGDLYNPDTRNLLSYAGSCRNRFSEGQILRMQSAILGMQTDRGYTFSYCPATLPEPGIHTIQQKSNGHFVDAYEHADQDFRLVTRPAQNNNTQRWVLMPLGMVCTIQQKSNDRFIDAHEHADQDFRLVTRSKQNNSTQYWVLTPIPGYLATYTIQQLSNGRFVDAHEHAGQDFRLVTRPAQNNDTQRWILSDIGDSVYTIRQRSSGRFVDAHEHAGQDFRLVTRPRQNNDTQRWLFHTIGYLYTIQQLSSGRFVDAHEYDGQDFRLVTRTVQFNDTQKWVVIEEGRDTYTLQQLSNGRFVDAHQHSGEDFRLVTRPRQNNDTQRWIIRPV